MEFPPATTHHQWLMQLVGQWTYVGECLMGPDKPPLVQRGRDVVRAIGDFWIVADGQVTTPEGDFTTMMTLGYDPAKERFVGTFVVSMMSTLWQYLGTLDAAGKLLQLDTEGPSMSGEGTSNYRDEIEIIDRDHRLFHAKLQKEDGSWHQFMRSEYHRVQ